MNKNAFRYLAIGASLVAILGLGAVILRTISPGASAVATTQSAIVVQQHFSYQSYTEDQRIDESDLIFMGAVEEISRTKWNQDSGEPWDDGLRVHELHVQVIEPIAGSLHEQELVTVTVLGTSPLDGHADYDLTPGTQAVFFVSRTDLAWRDGTHPVLVFVGNPADSYYRQASNGLFRGQSLSDLSGDIVARRD
jgi:hypothetical protein